MSKYSSSGLWFKALVIFVIAATLFDTHYVMPNYLPRGYLVEGNMYSPSTSLLGRYAYSLFKILFGIPLMVIQLNGNNFAFGAGSLGTAASSALVAYTLLIPYIGLLLFIIPSETGVPPAYRIFAFFITNSGAKHVDKSLGDHGELFDINAFERDAGKSRRDRYQAQMEAEQLEEAASRARKDAARTQEVVGRFSAEEEARTQAKVAAADAAEEAFRMRARKRAWERRRKDR